MSQILKNIIHYFNLGAFNKGEIGEFAMIILLLLAYDKLRCKH